MNRPQTSLAAVGALFALAFTFAASAGAADFKLRSCSRAVSITDEQSTALNWFERTAAPFPTTGACPDGLSLDTSQTTSARYWPRRGRWRIRPVNDLPINGVTLTLDGGDSSTDIKYFLTHCAGPGEYPSGGCPVAAQLPDRTVGHDPETLHYSFSDSREVHIEADCYSVECAPASPLKVHDVILEVRDTQPPYNTSSGMPGPNKWTTANAFNGTFSLGDTGSGLGFARAYLDSTENTPYASVNGCDFSSGAQPEFWPLSFGCKLSTPSIGVPADWRGVADGPHRILVVTRDAAGNDGRGGTTFKIDNTPPGAPEDIQISDETPDHWTASAKVSVKAINRLEGAADTTHSGIARIWHQIKRHGTDEAVSAPVPKLPSEVGGPVDMTIPDISVPEDGRWDFVVWAEDNVGLVGPKSVGVISRDRTPPPPPVLKTNPWLGRTTINNDYFQQLDVPDLTDVESGICGYAISINASEISTPEAKLTNRGAITKVRIPASTAGGRNWLHARAMSCAGLFSTTSNVAVNIDYDPPNTLLAGVPATTWTNRPATLLLNADDADSGMQSVSYSIEGGGLVTTSGDHAEFTIPEGRREVRYSATDVAGNISAEQRQMIGIDETAPVASFNPPDPLKPTRITGRVSDAASGVLNAQIQYHRQDRPNAPWRGLATSAASDPADAHTMMLAATLPDEQLEDGSYELRIVSTDLAGNVAAGSAINATGLPMLLSLPLRDRTLTTSLTAVRGRQCKTVSGANCSASACRRSKAKCRTFTGFDLVGARASRTVAFAAKTLLVGELSDSSGTPLADQPLKILSEIHTNDGSVRGRELVGTVSTDTNGRYKLPLLDGPSRRFTVQFAGDDLRLPAQATADVDVNAGLTLEANRLKLRAGQSLRLRGRLKGVPPGSSPANLVVSIEFWNGDGWQDAFHGTQTDARGRFTTIPYEFRNAVPRPRWLKIRAVVAPGDSSWPFDAGASNVLKLRIGN